MLQVSNWTGFYANGGVGYGLWEADTTTVNPVTARGATGYNTPLGDYTHATGPGGARGPVGPFAPVRR